MVLSQFRPFLNAEPVSGVSNSSPSINNFNDLLAYAQVEQQRGNSAEALAIYSQLTQESPLSSRGGEGNFLRRRAQEQINAIQGTDGFTAARAEYLVDRTMAGLFDLAPLGAMMGAGLTYRFARFALLGSAVRLGLSSPWVRPAASLLAFGAEASLFPVYGRMGALALGRQADWSSQALAHDIQSSFFVLGGLKFFGMAGNHGLRLWQQNPLLRGGLSQRILPTLVPQTAMYLGILSGHRAEQWAGLAPEISTGQLMAESFVTLAHFNGAARLIPTLGGPRVQQFERRLDQESGRIGEQWLDQVRTGMQHLVQGQNLALAGARVPGPRLVLPSFNEGGPLNSGPSIMMMSSNNQGKGQGRAGGAPAIRRGIPVRPDQTIVSIGRGSMLTTRGGTEATRSAAMNGIDHPETLVRLAEDFRLVRWKGINEEGQGTWIRLSDESILGREDIVRELGPPIASRKWSERNSLGRKCPASTRSPWSHAARVLAWVGPSFKVDGPFSQRDQGDLPARSSSQL